MLDLATLPLSLHKETAGSGLSRLDILRAKYSTTNNIAQQQASYQKLLADFPENNRNQYLMTHIHNALNLNIDYGTIKADLLKLPQINRPGDPITEAEIDRAIERTKRITGKRLSSATDSSCASDDHNRSSCTSCDAGHKQSGNF